MADLDGGRELTIRQRPEGEVSMVIEEQIGELVIRKNGEKTHLPPDRARRVADVTEAIMDGDGRPIKRVDGETFVNILRDWADDQQDTDAEISAGEEL